MKPRKHKNPKPKKPNIVKDPHVKYIINLVLTTVQKVNKILPSNPNSANPKTSP